MNYFFDSCIICGDDKLKCLLKKPCKQCKTIFFCKNCLHFYFKNYSNSCIQCKRKQINLYYTIYLVQIDYIMMIINIFAYYFTYKGQFVILLTNYLLSTSMLLRILLFDVWIFDYLNIFTNIFILMFFSKYFDYIFLQIVYFLYVFVYSVLKI